MTMAQDADNARSTLQYVDGFDPKVKVAKAAVYALLELAAAIRSLGSK